MYKIIGADGKEYGPISAEQVRQWVAEGRANAQTQVLAEGTTEWKRLADFPEFAGAATSSFPSSQPAFSNPSDHSAVLAQVNGPAIGLIVAGSINILVGLLRVVMAILGIGANAVQRSGDPQFDQFMAFSGVVGGLLGGVGILFAVFIILGGIKMRKLESRGLCITAAIFAMIPCISTCCLVGLPIGIWALVVLSKPEVKSAFH